MATHVFWDSFTHQGGWFVEKFPIFVKGIDFGVFVVPVFKILQHGSTLAGLVLLAVVCYRLRNEQARVTQILESRIKKMYFGSIGLTGMVMCLGRFIWNWFVFAGHGAIGAYIVTFLNGLILGTIVASLVLRNKVLNYKKDGVVSSL